jgi:spore maturation protein CgeB
MINLDEKTWEAAKAPREAMKPRICMPTARGFKKKAFYCGQYEAQDVLLDVDDVDLIHLEPGRGYEFKEAWQRRLLFRDVTRKLIFANPGLHKVRLTQQYDLFLVMCQMDHDFLDISAIDGWQDHCRTSVCWIDEMWAARIPLYKYWIHSLRRFDHIFVSARDSVAALSDAIGRPCRWLPNAVDTLRFSPYPKPPARVIDVYSIGRRREEIHRALLEAAGRRNIFYVRDTFGGSMSDVLNYREHRDFFSNMAKRSRFFVVAPAKVGRSEETAGQVEIGARYYEGASAGTVMIGQAPECEAFRELFPWQDAVISVQADGSDVIKVLSSLEAEPQRISAISRRNAAEALLRHDWVYRWKEILRVAGIELSPRVKLREQRLRGLAELSNACDDPRLSLTH